VRRLVVQRGGVGHDDRAGPGVDGEGARLVASDDRVGERLGSWPHMPIGR
jgi:hypothetical protein